MTRIITAKNVNHAIVDGIWWLRITGQREQSRNGEVLVAPSPVITEYGLPEQRVLFLPERDANPIFHMVESFWMLAGKNDVSPLLNFNKRMLEYAEPDGRIHGAYGFRWLNQWHDQLLIIIDLLKNDRDSRQAVLQMWHTELDLGVVKNDKPCNTHVYFDCREGRLNMTVCCRSNDMLWGAYGANAVHFSVLQEVVASGVGLPIGVYRQFSNNFHVYPDTDVFKKLWNSPPLAPYDPYEEGCRTIPLVGEGEDWLDFMWDCERLFGRGSPNFRTYFMTEVGYPLIQEYLNRKSLFKYDVEGIPDCDWKRAFVEWAQRRDNERE